jgi:hypothetical protein
MKAICLQNKEPAKLNIDIGEAKRSEVQKGGRANPVVRIDD